MYNALSQKYSYHINDYYESNPLQTAARNVTVSLHSMAFHLDGIGMPSFRDKPHHDGIGMQYAWQKPISDIGMETLVYSILYDIANIGIETPHSK